MKNHAVIFLLGKSSVRAKSLENKYEAANYILYHLKVHGLAYVITDVYMHVMQAYMSGGACLF